MPDYQAKWRMGGKAPCNKGLLFILLIFALLLLSGCAHKANNYTSNSTLEAEKYDDIVEEISNQVLDDAPAAIGKARDAGLIILDEGDFEGGYVPSSLAIINPDNGEVMLSVTLESEVAHPAEFSKKGYAVCMHGNIPVKYSFGRVNGLTKPELKIHFSGSSDSLKALQDAMEEWNKIPGIPHYSLSTSKKDSDVRVTIGKTGDYGLRAKEGGKITLASAAVKTVPGKYQLIFPDGAILRINTDGLKGGYDLKSVLTHELGHVLGLSDNYKDKSALMFWTFAPGETRRPTLDEVSALSSVHSKRFATDLDCTTLSEYHKQEIEPTKTNSCTGVTCDKPPQAYCGGKIFWTYESKGNCRNSKCVYRKTGVLCQKGCSGGTCISPVRSVPFTGSDSVSIG